MYHAAVRTRTAGPVDAHQDDTPGTGFSKSVSWSEEKIEETVAAFTSIENKHETRRRGTPALPKASAKYPFSAKERPARKRFDLAVWLKSVLSGKVLWANIGPVLVLSLLVFCMVFVQIKKPFQMLLDGKPIAFVQSKEAGQKLLEQANLELSSSYPVEANFRQASEISYTQDGVPIKTPLTEEQSVLDSLKSGVTWLVDGWTIAVGNERTVFLASKALAEEVLDNVKKSYMPSSDAVTVLSAEFLQPVQLLTEVIPAGNLGTPEQAFLTLTEGKEPLKEYTVQSGDSYWSIAQKSNIDVDELKRINGATSDNLKIGQVLRLNSPQPMLSVRTTVSALRQEDIPFDTVYKPNEQAWQGQTKLLEAGTVGTKEIKYEIEQINGILVERKVLSETVLAAPVDEVIESGTKLIAASRSADEISGGLLAWPVRGRINSPFGPRSRGFHSGIDIQASVGDPVYSAKAGRVTSATYSGAYGNMVVLDHGDGLGTLYAHLSQINVSVGQEVGVQELVGLAGTTGRVTGPHLHFEVRIDGTPENPVDYLG